MMCARFACVVGFSVFGSNLSGAPTKISMAVTGDCLVGGNSGKLPRTSDSDSQVFRPNGISRTTRNAITFPTTSLSISEWVTFHFGRSLRASITFAVSSRLVRNGKSIAAALTPLSSTSSATRLARLSAMRAEVAPFGTISNTWPYLGGSIVMTLAKRQPTAAFRLRHCLYSSTGDTCRIAPSVEQVYKMSAPTTISRWRRCDCTRTKEVR